MKTTELRTLIKESIQEYIREVETSGNIAAQEAKIRACEEAIALREKKINMEGLDEAYHDMIDEAKKKNLEKEIKELEKFKKKAEALLKKMQDKAAGVTKTAKKEDTETETEGIVDEVSIDPPSGPQLEEELRAGVYNDFAKWKGSFPEGTKFEQESGYMVAKDASGKELGKWNPASTMGMHADDPQYKSLEEAKKKMTSAQKEKKEDIVKGMKKSKSFGKSKDEKAKMYATATKLAKDTKKESVETEGEVLNESFLHMQKLAGLITETQYKQKMQMLNEVEASDIKVGNIYTAAMPTSNDGKERVDVKVKVLGPAKELSDNHFTIEFLEDKDYTNPVSKGQNRYKKGDQNNIEAKYLTAW